MSSDLTTIRQWWAGLGGPGFVALAPPTRSRYTQSDGHDDFVELGLSPDASFAYWHWQSHERAFDRTGEVIGPLLLHWGGDYETVRAGLGAGPDGYELHAHGPNGAFELEKITATDADGLPDPGDKAAVAKFLRELQEPVSRKVTDFVYPPLTDPQRVWLHARMRESDDIAVLHEVVAALGWRDEVTAEEAERVGRHWWDTYARNPMKPYGWGHLLHALLHHDNELGWTAAARLGAPANPILGDIGSERAVAMLRERAIAGDAGAVDGWVTARRALSGEDQYAAVAAVAADLHAAAGEDAVWDAFPEVLMRQSPGALPPVMWCARASLDTALPEGLRRALAQRAREQVGNLRRKAVELPGGTEVFPGYSTKQAKADIARFNDDTAALLAVSGPPLTASYSRLLESWDDYRSLSEGDIAWLRAQIAKPTTQIQGIAFCLELLYAHGVAGEAEVDALAPRWRKELTKKYETTYVEWRHPLVILTCLAQEIGHPEAAKLLAWWNRAAAPAWTKPLALQIALGAPREEAAEKLLDNFRTGDAGSGNSLITWALLRSRLDGREPVVHLDELLASEPDRPGWRKRGVQHALVRRGRSNAAAVALPDRHRAAVAQADLRGHAASGAVREREATGGAGAEYLGVREGDLLARRLARDWLAQNRPQLLWSRPARIAEIDLVMLS